MCFYSICSDICVEDLQIQTLLERLTNSTVNEEVKKHAKPWNIVHTSSYMYIVPRKLNAATSLKMTKL